MCGIGGIARFDGRPVLVEDLRPMSELLGHRGPDGEGTFTDGAVGFCHRRLAIIDPEGGEQPFLSTDGVAALTYNGEVYNYRELRRELEPHQQFVTDSDVEVVMRAYEEWGIACLKRFRGMFAFALYDRPKGVLYLVRDRLGIKPLYYYHTSKKLLFCSELAPLLKLDVPREIDLAGVAGYFKYQYVPTPHTIYRGIRKLEPGQFLEVNIRNGKISKQRYWALKVDVKERSEEAALDELNETLDETMRLYVRSDVPFAAFLSGGVDSSLVTALMTKQLSEPVHTVSIGFEERRFSELPYAAQMSQILHTDHYEKVVSPELALDVLQLIARHFGEPFADSSAIPTYYVSREASLQVKMVLSGDGGDELFGGYWSYERTFRDLMNPLNGLSKGSGKLLSRYGLLPKVKQWATLRAMGHVEKHNAQREIFNEQSLEQLLLFETDRPRSPSLSAELANSEIDLITRFQALDVQTYMLDDILTKVDRMSMSNSLEVRVPLLDHIIVELAFSLPLSLKLRFDTTRRRVLTKYLLKKSAARFFPERLLERPKQGFGIPVIEWCKGPLRPLLEERLCNPGNPIFDWLRYEHVQRILNAVVQGDPSFSAQLWAIFMFDLWVKEVHLAQ